MISRQSAADGHSLETMTDGKVVCNFIADFDELHRSICGQIIITGHLHLLERKATEMCRVKYLKPTL